MDGFVPAHFLGWYIKVGISAEQTYTIDSCCPHKRIAGFRSDIAPPDNHGHFQLKTYLNPLSAQMNLWWEVKVLQSLEEVV